MLITLITFTVLLPVIVQVLFVFLHLLFVVAFLFDTYANVFSISHAVGVPVPELNNHSSHGVGGCYRRIPLP